jgi:hypothetical protein
MLFSLCFTAFSLYGRSHLALVCSQSLCLAVFSRKDMGRTEVHHTSSTALGRYGFRGSPAPRFSTDLHSPSAPRFSTALQHRPSAPGTPALRLTLQHRASVPPFSTPLQYPASAPPFSTGHTRCARQTTATTAAATNLTANRPDSTLLAAVSIPRSAAPLSLKLKLYHIGSRRIRRKIGAACECGHPPSSEASRDKLWRGLWLGSEARCSTNVAAEYVTA